MEIQRKTTANSNLSLLSDSNSKSISLLDNSKVSKRTSIAESQRKSSNRRLSKFSSIKSRKKNLGTILLKETILKDSETTSQKVGENGLFRLPSSSLNFTPSVPSISTNPNQNEAEHVLNLIEKINDSEKRQSKFNWERKHDRMTITEKLKDAYDDRKRMRRDKKKSWQDIFYKKTAFLRYMLMILGFVSIFVTTPSWCEVLTHLDDQKINSFKMESVVNREALTFRNSSIEFLDGSFYQPRISQNCSYSVKERRNFYIKGIRYFNRVITFSIQALAMAFIILSYSVKNQLYKDLSRGRRRIMVKVIFLMILIIGFSLRYKFKFLPFDDIIYIIFFIFHSRILRRAFRRIFKIVTKIYQLLFLELFIIFLVTYLLTLLNYDYGENTKDAPLFYSYNYSNFRSIFITLLFLHTVNNFPDLIVDKNIMLVCLHLFITVFIIHAMILAFVNDVYTTVFQKELEERVEENHTVILAMDVVDEVKNLKFKNLKKLALEAIEEIKTGETVESFEVNSEGHHENKLGQRLLDCNLYLENLDTVMKIGKKGDSLRLIFRKKKKRDRGFFRRFTRRSKRVFVKNFEVFSLFLMLLSPLFISNHGDVSWPFFINLSISCLLMIKTIAVIRKKGRLYFFRVSDILQFIALIGLILSNIGLIITCIFTDETSEPLYYIWAFSNLSLIYPFFVYIETMSKIAKMLDIVIYAIRTTLPFLYVILVFYGIVSLIGCSLFGGDISSKTRDYYQEATFSELNRNYEKLNFNDFLNGLVFCWTMNIANQIPILVNMATLERFSGDGNWERVDRDRRGYFFILFIFLNNSILFNVFIGQIIGICLEYSQAMIEKRFKNVLDDSRIDSFIDSSQSRTSINFSNHNGDMGNIRKKSRSVCTGDTDLKRRQAITILR